MTDVLGSLVKDEDRGFYFRWGQYLEEAWKEYEKIWHENAPTKLAEWREDNPDASEEQTTVQKTKLHAPLRAPRSNDFGKKPPQILAL